MTAISDRTGDRTRATSLALHHVGLVVLDLDAAVAWACEAFGLTVELREPECTVDSVQIGIPAEEVRIRGALLRNDANDVFVELHMFPKPPSTAGQRDVHSTGIGHIAWQSKAIVADMERLAKLGVRWNQETPGYIAEGPYAGRRWIYGWSEEMHAVIELLQDDE